MAKLVHSMIRVLEEARSVDFYDKAFGLKIAERVPFDGFTLIYLSNPQSGFELELTVNDGKAEAYELGNGYGHLAVTVEDLEAEYKRFTDLGLTVGKLVEMPHDGKPFAKFFFVTDPDGYKTEVIQRGGRFK